MTPVFRDLRPDEQAECLDLWAQVFSPSHVSILTRLEGRMQR
ncbi:MAG: hypothetical protein KatS3mg017_0579 [Fimbriimonadales bacterium]|nr:MAG: hypothetical protein KatS3mg017_0579 [Fimbriimonadales bacterium]